MRKDSVLLILFAALTVATGLSFVTYDGPEKVRVKAFTDLRPVVRECLNSGRKPVITTEFVSKDPNDRTPSGWIVRCR